MPQRTNEFQELVSLIQSALAPAGAKITTSAMFKIPGLDTLREVDVLIEGEFGQYKIRIAVEAKDEIRKFNIGQFDLLLGKYRGECRVQVDKFIIVSRKGFTKGVVDKAKLVDVELLTLDEAKTKDWTTLKPGRLHFQFPPHICWIKVQPEIPGIDQKRIGTSGRLVCTCCGKDHGSLKEYVSKVVFCHFLPREPKLVTKFREQVTSSPEGQACLNITWELAHHGVQIDGTVHRITHVTTAVHAVSAVGQLHCREYELKSSTGSTRLVRHMTTTVGGKQIQVVMPDGLKSQKIALRIDPAARPANGSFKSARSPQVRVGRNDPCPCGSGAKFKKCCGTISARSSVTDTSPTSRNRSTPN